MKTPIHREIAIPSTDLTFKLASYLRAKRGNSEPENHAAADAGLVSSRIRAPTSRFGDGEFICGLQIEPEARAVAEELSQP